MAFSRLVFTVLVLCVVSQASHVPVYIWGDITRTQVPILHESNSEFSAILKKQLFSDPFVVVFEDETLSPEDFSRKNEEGHSSFPYLHSNLQDSIYFASVNSPLDTLASLLDLKDGNKATITETGLSADIEPKTGNRLFITLEDAMEGENRAEMLARHDTIMADTVAKLREHYPNLIAIYTADNPSWVVSSELAHFRSKRQAQNSGWFSVDDLLLYSRNIWLNDAGNTENLASLTSSSSNINETTLNATLVFNDKTLVLNFKLMAGYWYFDTITLTASGETIDLYPEIEVYALETFSYRCGPNVTFSARNSTKSVTLEDVKMQPFFTTNGNASQTFGDSFDCVGFFSAPIWSGLFVVFILLSITFYGIMMMMDIRTMDRFDDPKGRTITINAGE